LLDLFVATLLISVLVPRYVTSLIWSLIIMSGWLLTVALTAGYS
jgi:hypothetical protein